MYCKEKKRKDQEHRSGPTYTLKVCHNASLWVLLKLLDATSVMAVKLWKCSMICPYSMG